MDGDLFLLRRALGPSSVYCIEGGRLYLGHADELTVEIIDLVTCMAEGRFRLMVHDDSPWSLDGLHASGSKILGYNSTGGVFSVYDCDKRAGLCTLAKDLGPGQTVTSVCAGCASSNGDSMFFFTLSHEPHLYAILVMSTDEKTCSAISGAIKIEERMSYLAAGTESVSSFAGGIVETSGSVRVSERLSEPGNSSNKTSASYDASSETAILEPVDRVEGAVLSVSPHPTEAVVLVHLASGGVQVLRYEALRCTMRRGLGCPLEHEQDVGEINEEAACRGVDEPGDTFGDWGDDHLNQQGMGVSAGLGLDPQPSIADATQRHIVLSVGIALPSLRRKAQGSEQLVLCGVLLPPHELLAYRSSSSSSSGGGGAGSSSSGGGGGGDEGVTRNAAGTGSNSIATINNTSMSRSPDSTIAASNKSENSCEIRSISATQVVTDCTGALLGVFWRGSECCALAVYDCHQLAGSERHGVKPLAFSLLTGPRWPLAAIAFHPLEPVLLLAGDWGGGRRVAALSLQDSALRSVAFHDLTKEFGPQNVSHRSYRIDVCRLSGRVLLHVRAPIQGSGSSKWGPLCVSTLSGFFRRIHGFLSSPLVTPVATPLRAFIEGDKVFQIPEGNSADAWPKIWSVIAVATIPDAKIHLSAVRQGATLGRPLCLMTLVYESNLHALLLAPTDGKPVSTLLGPLVPMLATASHRHTATEKWCPIPTQDCLHSQPAHREAIFCPRRFCRNPLLALFTGTIWSGGADSISAGSAAALLSAPTSAPRSLSARPGVCIMHVPTDGPPESVLCYYRDAAIWGAQRSILSISPDGLALKLLPTGTSWALARPIEELWPVPYAHIHMADAVLFSAVASSAENESQWALLLSEAGQPAAISWDRALLLKPRERVLDVQWQPAEMADTEKAEVWFPPPRVALLGVLTDSRVLMLAASPNSSLKLMCEQTHSGQRFRGEVIGNAAFMQAFGDADAAATTPDPALSLSWAGAALLFSRESGDVGYMLPARPSPTMTPRGSCCTLPLSITRHGSLRLVAVLPDRLLVASTSPGQALLLACRPFLPLEPLLLSMFALLLSSRGGKGSCPPGRAEIVASVAETLVLAYVPAKLSPGTSTEHGALPSGHVSRRVCDVLSAASEGGVLANMAFLAALAAGVSSASSSYSTSTERGVNRWIPAETKFALALSAGCVVEACLEALSVRPELQEPFLDPSSYVDLPHPSSAVSVWLASAASRVSTFAVKCASASEQWEALSASCRLADIAGDEKLVASLLVSADIKGGRGCCEGVLRALVAAQRMAGVSEEAIRIATAHLGENPPPQPEKKPIVLNLALLTGPVRRPSMLPLTGSPLDIVAGAVATGRPSKSKQTRSTTADNLPAPAPAPEPAPAPASNAYLVALEARQRAIQDQRGGGLGPPTTLGLLAMDRIEDWVGARLRLELASGKNLRDQQSLAILGIGSRPGSQFGADAVQTTASVTMRDGSIAPASWIGGVGQDKDRLVGYWRFSDVARRGDDAFCCSDVRCGSRLCVLDLSRYGSASLELFGDSPKSLYLEPSTSSIDPGEDHEKVKTVFDVVVGQAGGGGLRVAVPRGSPLDVGLLHSASFAAERNRFTLEMSVAPASLGPAGAMLARRVCDVESVAGVALASATHSPQQPQVWSLHLAADGSLCWAFGDPSARQSKVFTAPGVVLLPESVEGSGQGDLVWSHIAVVLVSRNDNEAEVSLLVNGQRCAHAPLLSLPTALTESQLAHTALILAQGLPAGSRLTELRAWAEARGENEIDAQRESHLALASKRRRLQLRLKGSKQLFTPLLPPVAFVLGEACPVLVSCRIAGRDEEDAAPQEDNVVGNGAPKKESKPVLAPPRPLGPPHTKRTSAIPAPPTCSLLPPPGSKGVSATIQEGTPAASPSYESIHPAAKQLGSPSSSGIPVPVSSPERAERFIQRLSRKESSPTAAAATAIKPPSSISASSVSSVITTHTAVSVNEANADNKNSKIKVKVTERLEAEVAVSSSRISSLRLSGTVRAKADPGSAIFVADGLVLRMSIDAAASSPAQLTDTACNTDAFEVQEEQHKAVLCKGKVFVLQFKDATAFLSGGAPLDLSRYRLTPTFRPLLVLTRSKLAAQTGSDEPGTTGSGGTITRVKLRVEVEFNKNFFSGLAPLVLGDLEVRVHLASLLVTTGHLATIDSIKSPRTHTLVGNDLVWSLNPTDAAAVAAAAAVQGKPVLFDALLVLQHSQPAKPDSVSTVPTALPVKVIIVLPSQLISRLSIRVESPPAEEDCKAVFNSVAEYSFSV